MSAMGGKRTLGGARCWPIEMLDQLSNHDGRQLGAPVGHSDFENTMAIASARSCSILCIVSSTRAPISGGNSCLSAISSASVKSASALLNSKTYPPSVAQSAVVATN